MNNDELNAAVCELQDAMRCSPRDEDRVTDLYQAIRSACASVVGQVAVTFRQSLGDWVEDNADEILDHCLAKFPCPVVPNANFKGYYRSALVCRAIDWQRVCKAKNAKLIQSYSEAIDVESESPESGLDETTTPDQADRNRQADIENYAKRKRHLVDQIRWSSDDQRASMLLDQRRRMAKSFHAASPQNVVPVSAWCEQTERWLHNEPDLTISNNDATIQDCYEMLADHWDSADTDVCFRSKHLCETAYQLSGLQPATFRQRISRYLQRVRDELDHCEMLLFHIGPHSMETIDD